MGLEIENVHAMVIVATAYNEAKLLGVLLVDPMVGSTLLGYKIIDDA